MAIMPAVAGYVLSAPIDWTNIGAQNWTLNGPVNPRSMATLSSWG